MDVLRSCYTSFWHVFRDSETLTKGRYYFAPNDFPTYPGVHIFGSRNWTSELYERGGEPLLGEWAGPQEWSNGIRPKPMPLPILVGNADCIEQGELKPPIPAPMPPRPGTCVNYPLACYGIDQAEVAAFDIVCCGTVVDFAQAIDSLYNDPPQALDFLIDLLGQGYVYSTVAAAIGTVPSTIIAVGKIVLVVITGTTDNFQLAIQGLYAAVGLVDYGLYSTNPVFETGQEAIMARIATATGGTYDQIYLVGHSLGGAIAQLIAARLINAHPDRFVNVLTYGCPVTGDIRLNNLLNLTRQINYRNTGDPVPSLPPIGGDLISMFDFIVGAQRGKFLTLQPPAVRFVLFADGSVEESDDQILEFGVQRAVMETITALGTVQPFGEHSMAEYLRRLKLSCPAPVPPFVLPPTIRATLTGATFTHAGITYTLDFTWSFGWGGVGFTWVSLNDGVMSDVRLGAINGAFPLQTEGIGLVYPGEGEPAGIYLTACFLLIADPLTSFQIQFFLMPNVFWRAGGDPVTFAPDMYWFQDAGNPVNELILGAVTMGSFVVEPV